MKQMINAKYVIKVYIWLIIIVVKKISFTTLLVVSNTHLLKNHYFNAKGSLMPICVMKMLDAIQGIIWLTKGVVLTENSLIWKWINVIQYLQKVSPANKWTKKNVSNALMKLKTIYQMEFV